MQPLFALMSLLRSPNAIVFGAPRAGRWKRAEMPVQPSVYPEPWL